MNALARSFDALFGQRINFPDQAEVKWLNDQVKRSPDLGWLEQLEFALLFCPDDTKVGHSRHGLVSEGIHLCTAYTQHPYHFWEQRIGDERIPIPLRAKQGAKPIDLGDLSQFPQPYKMQGELRIILPFQFRLLDDYKENLVQFQRKRVNVIIPYHDKVTPWKEMVHVVRAYMYEGRPEYWDDVIDAGFRGFKPVRTFQSQRQWLKRYYAYPKEIKSDGE